MSMNLEQELLGIELQGGSGEAVAVSPPPLHTRIYQDIDMLSLLRASANGVAHTLSEHAKTRPSLGDALGGHVLEIGAGLAALSLALAKLFPTARFMAMDSDSNATRVAQNHISASGFAARVSIRLRDLIHVDERAAYSAAWAPAPFLPREGARIALDRLTLAIKPRGYLIIGNVASDGETSTSAATAQLLRSNGHQWRADEISGILRQQGYRDIERLSSCGGMELSIARRP